MHGQGAHGVSVTGSHIGGPWRRTACPGRPIGGGREGDRGAGDAGRDRNAIELSRTCAWPYSLLVSWRFRGSGTRSSTTGRTLLGVRYPAMRNPLPPISSMASCICAATCVAYPHRQRGVGGERIEHVRRGPIRVVHLAVRKRRHRGRGVGDDRSLHAIDRGDAAASDTADRFGARDVAVESRPGDMRAGHWAIRFRNFDLGTFTDEGNEIRRSGLVRLSPARP